MRVYISKKWMTVIGCVGFGLIILALGVYVISSGLSWYVWIPLGTGIAGVLAFWILSAIASRAMRRGSNVAVMIILVFIIVALVNFLSARNSRRIDVTTSKKFSLSDQTKKILENLEQEIRITTFYTSRHFARKAVEDILKEYELQSSKLAVRFKDPSREPSLAKDYNIGRADDGTVVFEMGERKKYVQSDTDLYADLELDFTSAILELNTAEQKKVYFLTGHDEHDPDLVTRGGYSEIKKRINADNYQTGKLYLRTQRSIPSDCSVLVIAGPKEPLSIEEEEAIADYLNKGGRAIIMVDPPPSLSLEGLLGKWGVDVHHDIVAEAEALSYIDRQTQIRDRFVLIAYSYNKEHPITALLPPESYRVLFSEARSLVPRAELRQDLMVVKLVEGSEDSWGETNLETVSWDREPENDKGIDIKGPVCMAIAVSLKQQAESFTPVLVVFGDSDFIADSILMGEYARYSHNLDLFMNSVNWLTEEAELISIRPKEQEPARLKFVTGKQLRFVGYFSIFVIPVLIMIIGGIVWLIRR